MLSRETSKRDACTAEGPAAEEASAADERQISEEASWLEPAEETAVGLTDEAERAPAEKAVPALAEKAVPALAEKAVPALAENAELTLADEELLAISSEGARAVKVTLHVGNDVMVFVDTGFAFSTPLNAEGSFLLGPLTRVFEVGNGAGTVDFGGDWERRGGDKEHRGGDAEWRGGETERWTGLPVGDLEPPVLSDADVSFRDSGGSCPPGAMPGIANRLFRFCVKLARLPPSLAGVRTL